MMNKNDVMMVKQIQLSHNKFVTSGFSPAKGRTLDSFTKKILYTAEWLFDKNYTRIDPYHTRVVLTTRTGPFSSLADIAQLINEHGYKGLNPSFPPNVMLSTALSYFVMHLDIRRPSCVLYDADGSGQDAFDYSIMQIRSHHCHAMILIYGDDAGRSERKYLVRKGLADENSAYKS